MPTITHVALQAGHPNKPVSISQRRCNSATWWMIRGNCVCSSVVYIYIDISMYMYIWIYIYTLFLAVKMPMHHNSTNPTICTSWQTEKKKTWASNKKTLKLISEHNTHPKKLTVSKKLMGPWKWYVRFQTFGYKYFKDTWWLMVVSILSKFGYKPMCVGLIH